MSILVKNMLMQQAKNLHYHQSTTLTEGEDCWANICNYEQIIADVGIIRLRKIVLHPEEVYTIHGGKSVCILASGYEWMSQD